MRNRRLFGVGLLLGLACFVFTGRSAAQDVSVAVDTSWEAGTYTYENVTVTNRATLTFKGRVVLNASALTIDQGAAISADAKGHALQEGPGAGRFPGGGGSHGGCGGGASSPAYGSSKSPVDLGSGGGNNYGGAYAGYGAPGGGAVELRISGPLVLNGRITANGGDTLGPGGAGSGGSIFISAAQLTGIGRITADGGSSGTGGRGAGGGGGGGRIAVHYGHSDIPSSSLSARGGAGSPAGQAGTIAFFDQARNDLQAFGGFDVRMSDGPSIYRHVSFSDAARVSFEEGVTLRAEDIEVINGSVVTLASSCRIDASKSLVLSGAGSGIMHKPVSNGIVIAASDLEVDAGACISADAAGYPPQQGPGAGQYRGGGGSYGGRGGGDSGPVYGSSQEPVDSGSGGANNYGGRFTGYGGAGGGAVRLDVRRTFTLDGTLTANGADTLGGGGAGSGGSVYVTAAQLTGAGRICVNGGDSGTGGSVSEIGGGGGGGRVVVYYGTSDFTGTCEAKGGNGAEEGTAVLKGSSTDVAFTMFTLDEKTSTNSVSSQTIAVRKIAMERVVASGGLAGSLDFNEFEIVKIASGSFSGKGFFRSSFAATLEGFSYEGAWRGVVYAVPAENRIYFKGAVSGEVSGSIEGYLTESAPGSGVYDRFHGAWAMDRLGQEEVSTIVDLEADLSFQPPFTFAADISIYQADMEGSAYGYYAGPLSAVITHVGIDSPGAYQGLGFSIISYNSAQGQGQSWAFNEAGGSGGVGFLGASEGPLKGVLAASLVENDAPRRLSGRITRLDLGVEPQPDLMVMVWAPRQVSPGQKIDYILEYRNDGLKAATEAILFDHLDPLVRFVSASQGAYYDQYLHQVTWQLGPLPSKSSGYLRITVELPWALPPHLPFENRAYLQDIVLHSTQENLISNGIGYDQKNSSETKKFSAFAHMNDAQWKILYEKTNDLTGSLEAYLASKDVPTQRNGVGESSGVSGYYPVCISYSGSTATFVNQAKNGRLSGEVLYLISPQLVTQEDLRIAKTKFNRIVVFQGDDLIRDGLDTRLKFYLMDLNGDNQISRFEMLFASGLADPPDPNTRDLLDTVEQVQGDEVTYLEIDSAAPGNKIKISWKNSPMTDFAITSSLQSEDGIDVLTLEGIKHDEWILLLIKFEEEFDRWPTVHDMEKLRKILEEKVRRNGIGRFKQETVTARDPNEMVVSPQGDVRPGDTLTYTINYENEGEGIAFGVYVTDVLEEDLDVTQLTVNDDGSYDPAARTLTWFIGELQPGGKGSVSFSVPVRPDAPDETEIINLATVYFPSVPEVTRTNGAVNRVMTRVDNVAPVSTFTLEPIANQAGWNNADVVISLSASDNEGGAGVRGIHYGLTGGYSDEKMVPGDTAQLLLSAEGVTTLTYAAEDNMGNREASRSTLIKIDKTGPVVSVRTPVENAEYLLNEMVYCGWSADDALSGIASVEAGAASGDLLDTDRTGTKEFTVAAVDLAGNQEQASVAYSVRYAFSGFLPPLNPDGSSVFKLGRVVPVKFQLRDAAGLSVSIATARIYVSKVSDRVAGTEMEAEAVGEANNGNLFVYDSADDQYIFNLGTRSLTSGTWQLRVELDDGLSKYATFSLR